MFAERSGNAQILLLLFVLIRVNPSAPSAQSFYFAQNGEHAEPFAVKFLVTVFIRFNLCLSSALFDFLYCCAVFICACPPKPWRRRVPASWQAWFQSPLPLLNRSHRCCFLIKTDGLERASYQRAGHDSFKSHFPGLSAQFHEFFRLKVTLYRRMIF